MQGRNPANGHYGGETSMISYDAVILGSGHNSLILQAYLSRAGLSTICLESRETIGGGLTTVQWPDSSGFWHNTHSFFHRGVTQLPWYRDLELRHHNAYYVCPELNVALIGRKGWVLEWWRDFDRTEASFAQLSAQDAATMRRWRDRFLPIVSQILDPEAQSPPLPPEQRQRLLCQSKLGRELLEVSKLSPLEFVRREFVHPAVQAALLFFNGLREVDLRCPGFGHHIPALLASDRMAEMCVGGSAMLATALVRDIQMHGGQVRTACRPTRICIENDKAAAVELEGGEVIGANLAVVSGLNPHQTFLELLRDIDLPRIWRNRAASYRYNVLAPLFALNLNLNEPPQYKVTGSHSEVADALMVIVGIDDAATFDEIVRHHQSGTIPPTVMWGSCPTRFDPSQAPTGRHTAFMWEKLPYRLHGNPEHWVDHRMHHAERMLRVWTEYAPNLDRAVLNWFAVSPREIPQALENMREADLLVGSFDHGQLGYHRPFPGAGHYRSHTTGLYLCGSCCHPGGNITGLPGYNAAQVILADLGRPAPWAPAPLVDRLPTQ
jgi:phytoene dehydrogenase-like protein